MRICATLKCATLDCATLDCAKMIHWTDLRRILKQMKTFWVDFIGIDEDITVFVRFYTLGQLIGEVLEGLGRREVQHWVELLYVLEIDLDLNSFRGGRKNFVRFFLEFLDFFGKNWKNAII